MSCRQGVGTNIVRTPAGRWRLPFTRFSYLEQMKRPRPRMFSALWIVAVSTLLASLLAGCSVQKRTTTRGFHLEHRFAWRHVPVAPVSAEIHGLPGCNRMSAPEHAEGLTRLAPKTIQPSEAFEVSRRSIFRVNEVSSPDSGARMSKAPESRREKLKNSILAVLGRPNTLDTASQVIDVPPAQLEELREEARKASRWIFLLGLLYLPWSIIQGEDYLIFQGIERQRRQNRTWWQWLLIGLSVASLFVLVIMFAAASVGVWIL